MSSLFNRLIPGDGVSSVDPGSSERPFEIPGVAFPAVPSVTSSTPVYSTDVSLLCRQSADPCSATSSVSRDNGRVSEEEDEVTIVDNTDVEVIDITNDDPSDGGVNDDVIIISARSNDEVICLADRETARIVVLDDNHTDLVNSDDDVVCVTSVSPSHSVSAGRDDVNAMSVPFQPSISTHQDDVIYRDAASVHSPPSMRVDRNDVICVDATSIPCPLSIPTDQDDADAMSIPSPPSMSTDQDDVICLDAISAPCPPSISADQDDVICVYAARVPSLPSMSAGQVDVICVDATRVSCPFSISPDRDENIDSHECATAYTTAVPNDAHRNTNSQFHLQQESNRLEELQVDSQSPESESSTLSSTNCLENLPGGLSSSNVRSRMPSGNYASFEQLTNESRNTPNALTDDCPISIKPLPEHQLCNSTSSSLSYTDGRGNGIAATDKFPKNSKQDGDAEVMPAVDSDDGHSCITSGFDSLNIVDVKSLSEKISLNSVEENPITDVTEIVEFCVADERACYISSVNCEDECSAEHVSGSCRSPGGKVLSVTDDAELTIEAKTPEPASSFDESRDHSKSTEDKMNLVHPETVSSDPYKKSVVFQNSCQVDVIDDHYFYNFASLQEMFEYCEHSERGSTPLINQTSPAVAPGSCSDRPDIGPLSLTRRFRLGVKERMDDDYGGDKIACPLDDKHASMSATRTPSRLVTTPKSDDLARMKERNATKDVKRDSGVRNENQFNRDVKNFLMQGNSSDVSCSKSGSLGRPEKSSVKSSKTVSDKKIRVCRKSLSLKRKVSQNRETDCSFCDSPTPNGARTRELETVDESCLLPVVHRSTQILKRRTIGAESPAKKRLVVRLPRLDSGMLDALRETDTATSVSTFTRENSASAETAVTGAPIHCVVYPVERNTNPPPVNSSLLGRDYTKTKTINAWNIENEERNSVDGISKNVHISGVSSSKTSNQQKKSKNTRFKNTKITKKTIELVAKSHVTKEELLGKSSSQSGNRGRSDKGNQWPRRKRSNSRFKTEKRQEQSGPHFPDSTVLVTLATNFPRKRIGRPKKAQRCLCRSGRLVVLLEGFGDLGFLGKSRRYDPDMPQKCCSQSFKKKRKKMKEAAFDKKVIAPFTMGWRRELVIRSPLSRLGNASPPLRIDVYYFTPGGQKLRSKPEISRYLSKHENMDLHLENFTFSKSRVYKEPFEIVRTATRQ